MTTDYTFKGFVCLHELTVSDFIFDGLTFEDYYFFG